MNSTTDKVICKQCGSTNLTRKSVVFICNDCGRRKKDITEAYRCVLNRIMSRPNQARYNAIFTQKRNADKNRIAKICEKFWPTEYDKRKKIDEFIINENLDEDYAKRLLDELESLLDRQGWE